MTEEKSLWKSKRYLVVLLIFIGYLNHSARVNISVAVVAMMNNVTDSNGVVIVSEIENKLKKLFIIAYLHSTKAFHGLNKRKE